MKITLNTNDIAQALYNDKNANWSYEGATALAEWLEEMEEGSEEEQELDVVAIRCDFSQFDNLSTWVKEYYGRDLSQSLADAGIDCEDCEDIDGLDNLRDGYNDELDNLIRDHINDRGTLIEFNGGVIVSSF